MSNVLFLVHRIPFPPDKGDKIRSYHLLRHLSKEHTVYLGAFIDNPEDGRYLSDVEKFCAEVCLLPIGGWRSYGAALRTLFLRRSLSVGFFRNRDLTKWVADLLARKKIDAIVAYSSTMAQYVPDDIPKELTVIADFVDVDSDKWRQYASESKWPKSLLYAYEANALSRWEASVLSRVDAVTVVSEAESLMMSDEAAGKVRVIRNGVDLDFFDPDRDCLNPYSGNRMVIVFTGAMDYFANEDGARWFAEKIWPTIKSRFPGAEFWIVGSNPTSAVLALGKIDGVTVTGRVPDIRPYLKHAKVAVAPLRLARGVQNKVLEALAMNLPVVSAPQVLQGLDGALPKKVVEASSGSTFSNAVCDLIGRNRSDGDEEGRHYVRECYDWDRNLAEFQRLIAPRAAQANCPGLLRQEEQ